MHWPALLSVIYTRLQLHEAGVFNRLLIATFPALTVLP
jgi:hypothetical protein